MNDDERFLCVLAEVHALLLQAGIAREHTVEPDLLIDFQGGFEGERLVEVLKERGFKWIKGYRYGRTLENGVSALIDFFKLPEGESPIDAVALPDAERSIARAVTLRVADTEWRVPDAAMFLMMKLRAKTEHRPKSTKDCFDIFTFAKLIGIKELTTAISTLTLDECQTIQRQLKALFWDENSPGVLDVVKESRLDGASAELLAADVVDTFAELTS